MNLALPEQYAQGVKILLAQSPLTKNLATNVPVTHWEPLKTASEVEISRLPGESTHKLRGIGIIAADTATVYDIVANQSDQWDDGLKEFKTLREEVDPCGAEIETAYARYNIGGGPFVKDRDFVYTEVRQQLPGGVYYVYARSVLPEEEAALSGIPSKGAVRGHMEDSGWVIAPTPDGQSHVTYVLAAELKGDIPKWLKNKGSADEVMVVNEVRKLALKRVAACQT